MQYNLEIINYIILFNFKNIKMECKRKSAKKKNIYYYISQMLAVHLY